MGEDAFVAAVTSAMPTSAAQDVGMAEERLEIARRMVHSQVESGATPSAVGIVARGGEVVLAEVAGVQGPHGAPLTFDHMWPLASAGKPMTAAVALSLVEEGRLGISEPVVQHLPELAGHDDVLLHHLLTHTSGWESAQRTHRLEKMVNAGELPELDPDRNAIDQIFMALAFDPVKRWEPGERMDYDNSHYNLLGEIARRLTGGTLDAAMRARIFEPLGMRSSALIVDDDLAGHCVTRAAGLPFGPDDILSFESEAFRTCDAGASGIHTSPADLLRFGQMILDGGVLDGSCVLSPATVRSMTTNRIPGVPAMFADRELRESSWGYGFTIIQSQPFAYFLGGLVPDGAVAHPGAGGINFWIDLEHEIVGVWFEVITEMSEFLEPVSGVGHRFQNVVTAAVLE